MKTEQILGVRFLNGTAAEAVREMSESGGLLVAPSGTCFERFLEDETYRRAILIADVALPDSGLMVTLWRLSQRRALTRISGLAYLKQLLAERGRELTGNTLWVLPNKRAEECLQASAPGWKIKIAAEDCYVAPIYPRAVSDPALLELIDRKRPRHIVIAIGAGSQEKLGWYLREKASYRAAIHCIGGALGFITGDQIAIPPWADRLYLGWFLRLLSQPRAFIPRLWKARVLPGLILKFGKQLPE